MKKADKLQIGSKSLLLLVLILLSKAEGREEEVYAGAEQFSLNIFEKINEIANVTKNVLLSPLSTWRLLAIIAEGSGKNSNTYSEFTNLLGVESLERIRREFRTISGALDAGADDVSVKAGEFIFYDKNRPVSNGYKSVIDNNYGSYVEEADFLAPNKEALVQTVQKMNEKIRAATNEEIKKAVHPRDIVDAQLLLVSTLFFKGAWTSPFNSSNTQTDRFFNENEEEIGQVEMMFQRGVFPFAAVKDISSHVLELPYGADKTYQMILIMPRKGVSIQSLIGMLNQSGMEKIYAELQRSSEEFEDDEVEVLIPKFEFLSDYSLNAPLMKLGLQDAFDSTKANFSGLSQNHNLFLSKILQTSRIIVNEEGTTATSVTTAVFANKATPPRFYANRPFVFMIVRKDLRLILFMGIHRVPSSAK